MRALTTSVILLIAASAAVGAEDPACSTSGTLPKDAVFIGYSRPGESQLSSIALVISKKLEPYDGHSLHVGLVLHEAASSSPASSSVAAVKPFMERKGDDHCEFPAELSLSPSKDWRIWASDSAIGLRRPTGDERDAFRKLKPDCRSRNDPDLPSECIYPQLLAVSDLDENGLPEYWHTTPYAWDTGLTISELDDGLGLKKILSACPGCSD